MPEIPTEITTMISRSGNSFHFKAVRALRELGWTVQVSPYYNDNVTDKSREIDLIAERVYQSSGAFPGTPTNIVVRLYIECKYVPPEAATAFWFDEKDLAQASLLIQRTGMRSPEENVLSERHHYYTDRKVAKLFDSGNRNMFEKALNQSLNATVYFRNYLQFVRIENRLPTTLVHYPVILTNTFDHFYEVDQGGEEVHGPITKTFQLEVNYAYLDKQKSSQKEYFLIDVVEAPQLEGFLDTLKSQDIKLIGDQIATSRFMERIQSEESPFAL